MESLEDIHREIRNCRSCPLCIGRNQAVPGEGSESAACMLIGESPGVEEDRLGRPFVGRSGRYLDSVLEEYDLCRKSLFITGSVKCHPPGNRDPRGVELQSCRPYLERQIEVISPRLIVLLGRIAARGFLGDVKLATERGVTRTYGDLVLLPTYHPAAAMRFPEKRRHFNEDIELLASMLRELGKADQ
jgi:DNA polymerase